MVTIELLKKNYRICNSGGNGKERVFNIFSHRKLYIYYNNLYPITLWIMRNGLDSIVMVMASMNCSYGYDINLYPTTQWFISFWAPEKGQYISLLPFFFFLTPRMACISV